MVYITLPLFCFFIGWLKWYWAIMVCVALIISLFFFCRKREDKDSIIFENNELLVLPKWMPFALLGIAFVYSFFCGIGRLWAQSKDYPWRNAIFRDLILRDWPVLYDKYKGALVYYIGLWLPPALPGKIAFSLSSDADISFLLGNIALLVYVTLGLAILFLLLLFYFKPKKKSIVYLLIFGFLFFSGMDIVASIEPLGANNYHLEWWARRYQYSSITTCMCWVFNQALIPWICMALLLNEKDIKNYVLIGMACLFSGPFPFVGFFIYCVANGSNYFIQFAKRKNLHKFWKELFSVSNILATFFIFPVIGLYFTTNAAISDPDGIGLVEQSSSVIEAIGIYIQFILIEFAVYALLIARRYYKNYLFYVTIVQLLIFPFIRIGGSADFTMRASIPAIFMMYIFCYKYIIEEKNSCLKRKNVIVTTKKGRDIQSLKKYGYILLVICLLLGMATPTVEFIRGFRQVYKRGINDPMTDFIYTMGGDGPYNRGIYSPEYNFVALDLDNKPFFRYLAKRKE